MARTTQTTQRRKPEPKGNGEVVEMDEIYSAEPLNEYLESVYSELGIEGEIDATVHVTQFQDNGMEAHIWRGDPADYDLESLAKKFGSGQYRVKVYVRDPNTGKKPQRANRVIAWKLTPDEDARIKQGLNAVPPLSAPTPAPLLTADAIALAVKNALPAPVVAPQINPMELMKSIGEVMRSFAPQPQQNSVSPMEVMRLFANVMRESRDAEPIERGVNAGPGDIFLRLIDKFAPLFEKTLAGQASATPQLNAPAQTGQPPQPQLTEQDEMNLRLKMGLAFLVAQAEAGNDATTYADVVLDNVPDEALEALAKNENWFDELSAVEPKIRQHRQWFVTLMNEVREALKDEETDDDSPAA